MSNSDGKQYISLEFSDSMIRRWSGLIWDCSQDQTRSSDAQSFMLHNQKCHGALVQNDEPGRAAKYAPLKGLNGGFSGNPAK